MTDAELTRLLAVVGAVTGIIGAIAGLSALGWDYFKWTRTDRARITLKVLPKMEFRDGPHGIAHDVIMANVVNVGKLTTTITHFSLVNFRFTWKLQLLRRLKLYKGPMQGLLITDPISQPPPIVLEPGHEWTGMISINSEELEDFKKISPKMWVSITHNLSDKPVLQPLKLVDN
jgi:hypothetical protein